MARSVLAGLTRRRLAIALALFFLALAVPTAVLTVEARAQLKWEAFHRQRVAAEELAARVDAGLARLIEREERRRFADYGFLVVAGDPAANYLAPSPLAAYPVEAAIPGLIGHFQVDAGGLLTTPLLPVDARVADDFGVSAEERRMRAALEAHIRSILTDNRLVAGDAARAPPAEADDEARKREKAAQGKAERAAEAASIDRRVAEQRAVEQRAAAPALAPQAAFDRLNVGEVEPKEQAAPSLGRVEELELASPYSVEESRAPLKKQLRDGPAPKRRQARKEKSALPESLRADLPAAASRLSPAPEPVRISTFESEVDPFEFSLLGSGHFVLFRKVWRERERYIQGALIDRVALIDDVVGAAFRGTSLAGSTNLAVAYRGDVLAALAGSGDGGSRYSSSAADLAGALLYRTRLSAPLGDLELIFTVTRLEPGPGGRVITWAAIVLGIVLCAGTGLMYRLGAKQIELAMQQQDFVSAVSHELKTPLTSIRMYGEMLREGWASESKKSEYYEYILDESERLSRLIANVLQLARMTRNELTPDLARVPVGALLDGVRSKVAAHIERAGFELEVGCDAEIEAVDLDVDGDFFSQIVINLVDNAIKFSAKADRKRIEIHARRSRDAVVFAVRDHGPGVARDQMRKIFRLFYRSENELTRETVGTGIGLALVHQLALAMGATVDVATREPGAEFTLRFPIPTDGRELPPVREPASAAGQR